MILKKSDLLRNKHFLLLSMFKTVMLLSIFVETVKYIFQDYLITKNLKRNIICIYWHVHYIIL